MRGHVVVHSDSLRQRALVVSLALLLFVGLVLAFGSQAAGWASQCLLLGWLIILVALASGALVLHWPRLGSAVLLAGMSLLIVRAAVWFEIGGLLALLMIPTASLLTMWGWREAAIGAIGFAVAAVLVGHALGDSMAAVLSVLLQGATLAFLSIALLQAEALADWYESTWRASQQQLDEALDQRVKLKQAQEDLLQANTELARLTERLTAMRRVAEESRNAKEEFVANVSHELRTPLNMIIGFAEMIAQAPASYGRLPPRLLADIDVILNNSRHLSSLVDDVLDLSQSDVGRMALTRRWVSINTILESAVTVVRPLFDANGLWLHVDAEEGLMAYCDEVRIRQVVVNLLSNAGRYTRSGGATIRAWSEGGDIVVAAEDTGPGISPEDQQLIFEPFRRLSAAEGQTVKGSGLGLSISRRFVEMHGGRMWLESAPGVGSTFYFRLPIDRVAPADEDSTGISRWFSPYHEYDTRRRPVQTPLRQLNPRFVVVESGDVIQRLLARYQADAEVVKASTLEDSIAQCARVPAMALVVNQPPDERITGPVAPLVDLPYGIPVVSCWMPDRREAAQALGVLDYLLKPVDLEELLRAVELAGPAAKTILIVDDEPDALQLFSRMLTASGRRYSILLAESGAEALAMMRERRPDLVLLDLVMPGEDGYSVLRIKREDPEIASIPVLAVSAQDPAGGPLPSNFVTIARSGGLYAQDLLDTIRAVTAVLTPPDRLGDQEPAAARRA